MKIVTRLLVEESDILLVFAVVGILLILIIPFPPPVLDFLICLSISITILLLLITLNIKRPLEFSSFPSVLLLITLFRLALNVASTRLILLKGNAGEVIQAFGFFVVGGDAVVGLILFAILIIIQFIVITKGASRISEVAARFTLDAMPGKQMSIDADLNAGAITEDIARQRRQEITQQAEFYGAMDGASKFVRGDAIAGIIIIIVNIFGGIILGIIRGIPVAEAVQTYVILTVGDGLVSQIPALLIALTTGILTTKTSSESHLAEELKQQLTRYPRTIAMTTVVILCFGLMPGLPFFPFFSLSLVLSAIFFFLHKSVEKQAAMAEKQRQIDEEAERQPAKEEAEEQWLRLDRLRIELGYELLDLADPKHHPTLMERIVSLRRQLAQEYGLVIPSIHIVDNLRLPPRRYRIMLEGEVIAEDSLYPNHYLAIDGGVVQPGEELPGIETRDPSFGLAAIWIDDSQKDQAQLMGYTVINAVAVLVTHLSEILKKNFAKILSRDDAQFLVQIAEKNSPVLLKNAVPEVVPLSLLHQVLQQLLTENISILNLPRIVEVLSQNIGKIRDIEKLTEIVRQNLSSAITAKYQNPDGTLSVITIAPENEQKLRDVVTASAAVNPDFLQNIVAHIADIKQKSATTDQNPVVLVSVDIRRGLRELLCYSLPDIPVLSFQEVMKVPQIRCIGIVPAA